MKIAFIHYHLQTGGVTTVIRQQVQALTSVGWEVMVLTGDIPPADDFPCEVHFIPGLGYEHLLDDEHSAKSVIQSILGVLMKRWPGGPDVVHVHNPTLAKNKLLQQVLKSLQAAGIKLLCQIHDFAEDGRPAAFFKDEYVTNCHYAAINRRDYHLLLEAGLVETGCHILPNAVVAPEKQACTSCDETAPVLYPVRALRRKNIGEAILLTLFHQPPARLVITQPPNSPEDIECCLDWKSFVERHNLPIQFDAGAGTDFDTLMTQCRYVVTTSINEGFGFAFLEAWLAGKPVWGRLLPDICQGLIEAGVVLDHLYERLWIPLAWLDTALLAQRWKSTMGRMVVRFKYPCSHAEINAAWHKVSDNNRIDFGMLDEMFQQHVIEKVLSEKFAREELADFNPFLNQPGPVQDNKELINKNKSVVVRYYGLENYTSRLTHLYTHVVNNDVVQSIDKEKLLKAFFDPQHFSLLKWGGALC